MRPAERPPNGDAIGAGVGPGKSCKGRGDGAGVGSCKVRSDGIDAIIEAVLYEGYVLYPYRSTAVKNRKRWTFGGLYPAADCSGAGEPCRILAQCLIDGDGNTAVTIEAGFLQTVDRRVSARNAGGVFEDVDAIDVDGRRVCAWQEAVERRVPVPLQRLADLLAGPHTFPFAFPPERTEEALIDAVGADVGRLTRMQAPIAGAVTVMAEAVAQGAFRLTLTIENRSAGAKLAPGDQAAATDARVLMSTHAVLAVERGAFVSLIDPPAAWADAAATCRNDGCFPVLAGDPASTNRMLVSPIILYDHPQIAPESPGTFFDGTEMDEMLALRILTLTDGEKREMAALDPRSNALLARVDRLGADLGQLHGTWRPGSDGESGARAAGPQLAFARIDGRDIRVRDRVRLRPGPRGDIIDTALAGRTATIEAIERDFDNRVHVAVTIDDDPGRDLGADRMPGHRFFFAPDELEPIEGAR